MGKLSCCSLSNRERSKNFLHDNDSDSVKTGSCCGSPTKVTVVGLYLNGMSDSDVSRQM